MGTATSMRTSVRKIIDTYGSTASLYSYADATVTESRGEDTTIVWGGATSLQVVSMRNTKFKKMAAMFGIESDETGRSFFVRDTVTVAAQDKIVVDGVAYEVTEIQKYDPIENTNIVYKIMIDRNEVYD